MLAGDPNRTSPPPDFAKEVEIEGLVTLKMGHKLGGSVLIPEHLFIKFGKWRFFQPSFFRPPLLGFDVEPGLHVADFDVDFAKPYLVGGQRVRIRIFSHDLVRSYVNGTQLYRCQILAPKTIYRHAAGTCSRVGDNFFLELFHHTTLNGLKGILSSMEMYGSPWNLQGTRKLENVQHAYFTSLARIRNEQDLMRIAMSSTGKIHFQTTSERVLEETLTLKVYRDNTTGRLARVRVHVPSVLLAPPHLRFHPAVRGNPCYYEIVSPEIYRVGLEKGQNLKIPKRQVSIDQEGIKEFSYIVIGNAANLAGLAAPFDEEETEDVMHVELLEGDVDLFQFWQEHANTDQVTGRVTQYRQLEDGQ